MRFSKFVIAGLPVLLSACSPAQQSPISQNWALGGGQMPAVGASTAMNPAAAGNVPLTGAVANTSGLGLVDLLVNQLGVNSQQALGGVGSIFALAQQRMNPNDFMQLTGTVPGMNQYLSAVPQPASSNFLFGSAAGLMGGQAGALGNLAALAGSFQSLGMNADMIGQFVPVVLQYVQSQGGPAAMSLLQNSLY